MGDDVGLCGDFAYLVENEQGDASDDAGEEYLGDILGAGIAHDDFRCSENKEVENADGEDDGRDDEVMFRFKNGAVLQIEFHAHEHGQEGGATDTQHIGQKNQRRGDDS